MGREKSWGTKERERRPRVRARAHYVWAIYCSFPGFPVVRPSPPAGYDKTHRTAERWGDWRLGGANPRPKALPRDPGRLPRKHGERGNARQAGRTETTEGRPGGGRRFALPFAVAGLIPRGTVLLRALLPASLARAVASPAASPPRKPPRLRSICSYRPSSRQEAARCFARPCRVSCVKSFGSRYLDF